MERKRFFVLVFYETWVQEWVKVVSANVVKKKDTKAILEKGSEGTLAIFEDNDLLVGSGGSTNSRNAAFLWLHVNNAN